MSLNTFWKQRLQTRPQIELSHGVLLGFGGDMLQWRRACDVTQWSFRVWALIQHITTDEVFSRLGSGVRRCPTCIARYNEWIAWCRINRPDYRP